MTKVREVLAGAARVANAGREMDPCDPLVVEARVLLDHVRMCAYGRVSAEEKLALAMFYVEHSLSSAAQRACCAADDAPSDFGGYDASYAPRKWPR